MGNAGRKKGGRNPMVSVRFLRHYSPAAISHLSTLFCEEYKDKGTTLGI